MDILQAFVLDNTTHNVAIKWADDKPLFRASEIGDILEIKNVRTSIKNFDLDEKQVLIVYTNGGERENIFLTEQGVYRLLMLSRKPIARPFQKWVAQVITTIRETGKYEMEQKLEQAIQLEAQKTITGIAQNLHNSLIEAFRGPDRYVVYFGKIRDTDKNTSLIKIGSTKDIKGRMFSLPREFGDIKMFHVIDCPMNEAFERFLHSHSFIANLKYKEPITENHSSNEVFEMTEDQLNKALRIAKCNIHKFSSAASADQMLEIQRLRLEEAHLRLEEVNAHLEIVKINAAPINEAIIVNAIDDDYIDPILLYGDARKYTQARGQKVQCYSADGKNLVQTYEGHTDAIRKLAIEDPSASRIKAAIQSNTVYRGYRWAFLERNLPNDTVQDIGETKDSIEIRKGHVAMLNISKTRIEKVYCDQKDAAKDREVKASSAICAAIKLQRKCQGHYFMMWNDCSQDLRDEFLSRDALPEKRVLPKSRPIEKLHPITENVLQKYASVVDVLHDLRIARKSLLDAAEFGFIAKGYKWRYATAS
jgi:prophage antirepressor-like protein